MVLSHLCPWFQLKNLPGGVRRSEKLKLDLSQGQHLQLKGAQAGETTLLAEGKDAWLPSLHFPISMLFLKH